MVTLSYYCSLNLKMKRSDIIKQVAEEVDMPYHLVNLVYSSFWEFIKVTIKDLPLKEDLTEEQFNKLRTNFNIPSLGKLHCTYEKYSAINKKIKEKINNENKEN